MASAAVVAATIAAGLASLAFTDFADGLASIAGTDFAEGFASIAGTLDAALRGGAGFRAAGVGSIAASAAFNASLADNVADPLLPGLAAAPVFGVTAMTILRLLHCTISLRI